MHSGECVRVYVLHTHGSNQRVLILGSGTARHTAVEEGDDIGGSIVALSVAAARCVFGSRCPLRIWKPLPAAYLEAAA